MRIEIITQNNMCTVTVIVDEKALRRANPDLSDMVAIRRWAQQWVDYGFQELLDEEDDVVDLEAAREMLHQTIRDEYARV